MQRTDTQSLERREIFVPRSAVVVEGGNQRKIRALASNGSVDRYNSRVNPLGMRPPQSGLSLLMNHDRNQIIGRVDSVERNASGVTIEATISDERAWNLVYSRSISGVSIGFIVFGARAGAGDEADDIFDWELCRSLLDAGSRQPRSDDRERARPAGEAVHDHRNHPDAAPGVEHAGLALHPAQDRTVQHLPGGRRPGQRPTALRDRSGNFGRARKTLRHADPRD